MLAQTLLALLTQRAATASICPSEVARACATPGTEWRAAMPAVRAVAQTLAQQGRIVITRGAKTLDPEALGRGPIRLRRGPRFTPYE